MKSESEVRELRDTLEWIFDEAQGERHSRLTYCIECGEWWTGPDYEREFEHDHYEKLLVSDYEETELVGFKQALDWFLEE